MTGDFPGTFHADYFNIQQGPGGPIKMDATHAITTDRGHTRHLRRDPPHPPRLSQASLEPTRGSTSSESTGKFAGATGLLHTSGTVNLGTLEGAIGFKGKICFA